MLTKEQKEQIIVQLQDICRARFIEPVNDVIRKVVDACDKIPQSEIARAKKYSCNPIEEEKIVIGDGKLTSIYTDSRYNNGGVRYAKIGIGNTDFILEVEHEKLGVNPVDEKIAIKYMVGGSYKSIREFVEGNIDTNPDIIIRLKKGGLENDKVMNKLLVCIAGYAEWFTKRWGKCIANANKIESENDNSILAEFGMINNNDGKKLCCWKVSVKKMEVK